MIDLNALPAPQVVELLSFEAILAAANLVIGVRPDVLAALAPPIAGVEALTVGHIVFQLQIVASGLVCFIVLLGLLSPSAIHAIDFDWLWRRAPVLAWHRAAGLLAPARAPAARLSKALKARIAAVSPRLPTLLSEAANWRTGDIALAATASCC